MSANKLCWKCREEIEKEPIYNIFPSDHCHCSEPEEKPKENKINLDKVLMVRENPNEISIKYGHVFLLTITPLGFKREGGVDLCCNETVRLPTDKKGRIKFIDEE